jgi:hypothetical protein
MDSVEKLSKFSLVASDQAYDSKPFRVRHRIGALQTAPLLIPGVAGRGDNGLAPRTA